MAKIKKEITGASSQSLAEAFKCGECLHYRNHKHKTHEKLCIEEGVRAFAAAPKCFTPNVTKLLKNSDTFVQMTALFSNFTPQEKRLFLGVLRASSKTKKKDYQFGTKLYFKVGKDYISNYLCGYVMGYTSAGELILSGSPDRRTRGSSFLSLSESTEGFLTHTDWKAKRKELFAQGKINDPQKGLVKVTQADQYEPPTIDSAPASWHDKKKDARKRKRTDAVDKSMSLTY